MPTRPCGLTGITTGPDGALWFAEYVGGRVGRITTTGAVTEYAIPSADAHGSSITTGPDGALWFAEGCSDRVGRITTTGLMREYPVRSLHCIADITAGPDGALWLPDRQVVSSIELIVHIPQWPLRPRCR